MMINIRSIRGHKAELEFHLEQRKPHILMLQETWLDDSTEDIQVKGYFKVSRRDRSGEANRGGIMTLARNDFNQLVHIENSKVEERSWHYLNVGVENLLVGN